MSITTWLFMDEGLKVELEFWRSDVAKYPGEDYAAIRASNLSAKMTYFPDYGELSGKGLDLGCGPTSIFEGSFLTQGENEIYAVDPLLEHYQEIYRPETPTVKYTLGYKDGGPLPFAANSFDYIFCMNVIDHTRRFVPLINEMARTLRPDGVLFFMVNFDWVLTPPNHAAIWRWEDVQRFVASSLFPERQTVVYNYEHKKYAYWGKFIKPC